MYFEIENTPESVKRARKAENVMEEVEEICPRLILAPFTKPPQVVFENVLVGTTCEKELEVLNPAKHSQRITLSKSLPPGLVIHLPGECLQIEPGTCYCVSMQWTPTQLVSHRETIRFTNDDRGRHDIIVVLKSIVPAKSKSNHPKFKTSPGKIKKKTAKRSPVQIYKKKIEAVRSTVIGKKTFNIVQSTQYKVVNPVNIENDFSNDYTLDSDSRNCPFDSYIDFDNLNSSKLFSKAPRPEAAILHNTYDKSYSTLGIDKSQSEPNNILKPSNKQVCEASFSNVFDNLTFTPLKSVPSKNEKLDKGPRIIISVNSESDFDDSIDIKNCNKENETHSVICVTSIQHPTKWLTTDDFTHNSPVVHKKIPNTSSPKDLNSPNFSINTDFSQISDMSFFPQRFSTERKVMQKINNDTHEIVDDTNMKCKLSSDTYTKESPNTPIDYRVNRNNSEFRHMSSFAKESYPKVCRQSLFKEQHNIKEFNERNYSDCPEQYPWNNDRRADVKSPRSLMPSLQSIPEERVQFLDTHAFNKTGNHATTFTIDQTFDRLSDLSSVSVNRQSAWSKRAVRADMALWKTPVLLTKKATKPNESINNKESLNNSTTKFIETNRTINESSYLNYVGNVYSKSSTVDPFLSATYYYDKVAVANFENEFKRWLNYVLTPPADLDSNIEQKVDVGKVWIENRNKEVPLAPTKEQVCSTYHNSLRLESLRRSARALLRSPEITQVSDKLQAQINKKLIAIRNDKNLHLDIGLQKLILEIIHSYNPLWLRIGLETIYGLVLPLKSNNDIEGLTTFIIQRMFKNPFLKGKHSKTSAPNMLLPAYMEALKKFTLKKFFILVFFLDQAKQKKLIPHDPCLFRRNALCKDSKAILINFTKELIAGIGDITRHLRPLGYIVSHKQSYLDEYIYAVNNIAVDIRDGVRLTKVMEIILMKNGLLHQLRTPAISRLQKIHNVQVALNALKDANFVIVGDISAADIADGHREKTLSLLWQLIHVFRAPLFEKAANVIQVWWKKKYQVIVEKRKEEERLLERRHIAASIIQYWWRRTQYNRMVEQEMQKMTAATVVLQKYWRMFLCRSRFRKLKSSALKISEWYKNITLKRQAIEALLVLRYKRAELRRNSATLIQAYVRRWLCVMRYKRIKRKVILIQSVIRQFIAHKQYKSYRKAVIFVQRKYRGKLLMRKEMKTLTMKRNCAIRIQSYYRMWRQRTYYKDLKKSVVTIEKYYTALMLMRKDRMYYIRLKEITSKVQASYRRNKLRLEYLRVHNLIVKLQIKVRAHQAMKKYRANYLKKRNAAIVIQNHFRAYQDMKLARATYISVRNSVILIQRYYRAYLNKKTQRSEYLLLRQTVIQLQTRYRSLLAMRRERSAYLKLRNSVLTVQRRYRAKVLMRESFNKYQELKNAVLILQRRFRAYLKMREVRQNYLTMKSACITIQNTLRAHLQRKRQRQIYLKQKESTLRIQRWYRSLKRTHQVKQQYLKTKQACITIQTMYKAYCAGKIQRNQYIKIRNATVYIQKYYRNYLLTRNVRKEFLELKKSTIAIQQFYRRWLESKKQRQTYLKIRQATVTIQMHYRQHQIAQKTRQEFCSLKSATICIQQRYRSTLTMRENRESYLHLKHCTVNIQRRFRALQAMRIQRLDYLRQLSAIITLQKRFKAIYVMKQVRSQYLELRQASIIIQRAFRAHREGTEQRRKYLKIRQATLTTQQRFRGLITMRSDRKSYLQKRSAAILIQRLFRARQMMLTERTKFIKMVDSCKKIQLFYRARSIGIKQRENYMRIRSAVIIIQKRWRECRETKTLRSYYIKLRRVTISIQRLIRANNDSKLLAKKMLVDKIQTWYLSIKQRNECRSKFVDIRRKVIILQTYFRAYIYRKRYLSQRKAAITIQRYYRNHKLAKLERERYIQLRCSIIKLQAFVRGFAQKKRYSRLRNSILTLQAIYRFKKLRALTQKRREVAAICIQKNVRRYLAQSHYKRLRTKAIFIQTSWRNYLITRRIRFEFLRKKTLILNLQAVIRGYLVRKDFEKKKLQLLKLKEEQRRNWAAFKIQALFKGHIVRVQQGAPAAELRRRWREGALRSQQESLDKRNRDALQVISQFSDIHSVIRAFKSLKLLTEVMPMLYHSNASSVVHHVNAYIAVMNRSISSVEVLKLGTAVLVNLARYRFTGPKIYKRNHITQTLKMMWRFSKSETQLFCIQCTYIWLFSKYEAVKQDLTEFLHSRENHKMLLTIKDSVNGMIKRNQNKNKFSKTQLHTSSARLMSESLGDMNVTRSSACNNSLLPALEPDYGIARIDQPRYFEDAQTAINCVFAAYGLSK